MRSAMRDLLGRGFLWRAAGRQIGDQRRAQLRPAAAAILDEEARQSPDSFELGAVDDGAALPLGIDQPGAGQDGEMRRHRVVGNVHAARDLARRQAIGLALHQEPKHIQPCRLGERRESEDSPICVHMSRLLDIWTLCKGRDGIAAGLLVDGGSQRTDDAAISDGAVLAAADDVAEFVAERIEVRDLALDLGQMLAGDHVYCFA